MGISITLAKQILGEMERKLADDNSIIEGRRQSQGIEEQNKLRLKLCQVKLS